MTADEYKQILRERSAVPLSRRERWLAVLLPPLISYFYLGIARLNGEGYRRKASQYWRTLMIRYAGLLVLVFVWAFMARFVY